MMTNYARKGFRALIISVTISFLALGAMFYSRSLLSAERMSVILPSAYAGADDLIEEDHIMEREEPPHLGELVYASFEEVAEKLRISGRDRVYDLHCGVGKLAMCAYLKSYVKKSIGIDPSETYFKEARKARKVIQDADFINGYRQLAYMHADPAQVDLHDATVIFMCSPYFLKASVQVFVDKFLTLKPGLRILTLKKLSEHPRLELVETLHLVTSWADSMPFYYYKLLPVQ